MGVSALSIALEHIEYLYMPKTPFERQALSDVSAIIDEGSFTAIAGHTGSGKSTLLQHLNGLLHPTRGRVLVDGVDLQPADKKMRQAVKEARHKVGMVFQYPEQQLFEETVEADVAFGPRNLGCTEQEISQRVQEALQLVHLDYDTYAKRSPFQLSGGQKRRVAIAGVLALRPKYLVLDEPTAGLDPRGREELIRTIRRLHEKQGMTIIFVSHNMDDIARLADHLLVLNQGRLVCDDVPKHAFAQEAMLREAGLRPPHVLKLMQDLCAAGLPLQEETALTMHEAMDEILAAYRRQTSKTRQRKEKGGKP